MTYWESFKNFVSNLGKTARAVVSEAALPEVSFSLRSSEAANRLSNFYYQKAQTAENKEEANKYYSLALKFSQRGAELAKQAQKQVIVGTKTLTKLPQAVGVLGGGVVSGMVGGATGQLAEIGTKKMLSPQLEEVEKARAKVNVDFYRKRYPEAQIPQDISPIEQEKLFKEYVSQRAQQTIKEEDVFANPKTNIFFKTLRAGFLKNIKEDLTRGISQTFEDLGVPEISVPALEKAEKYAREADIFIKKASVPDTEEVLRDLAKDPIGEFPKTVGYFVGYTLPYMMSIFGSALAFRKTKIPAGGLTNYFIIKGDLQKELEDKGIPREKAHDYASLGAWIEAQIEEGFGFAPDKVARWFSPASQEIIKGSFRSFLPKIPYKAVNYVLNLIEEGGEEALQMWTEKIIKQWAGTEDFRKQTIPELIRQTRDEFLGGFLGAIPFGASEFISPTAQKEILKPAEGIEEETAKEAIKETKEEGKLIKEETKKEVMEEAKPEGVKPEVELEAKPEAKPAETTELTRGQTETIREMPAVQPPLETVVDKETPEEKISQAKLRIAEVEGLPEDILTPYEVRHHSILHEQTDEFYSTLSEDDIRRYLQNPSELPANVSPRYFAALVIKNSKDISLKQMAINSEIFESITPAAQLMAEQRDIVHKTPLGWYKEISSVKRKRIEEIYGKKAPLVVDEATSSLEKHIEKVIAKNLTVGNQPLFEAISQGKINIWDLLNSTYEEKVKTLSPYFKNDPVGLHRAATELEGKTLLKNIEAGINNWIDKYSKANRYSPEKIKEIQEAKEEFLKTHEKQIQSLKAKRKIIGDFAKLITGYNLSQKEIEEIAPIIDTLVDVGSRPDFADLPTNHPLIMKFGAAKVAYEHFLLKIRGAYSSIGEWGDEMMEKIKNSSSEEALSWAAQTLNDFFISIKATLDNSFLGKQGSHMFFRNFRSWLKGAEKSFSAMFSGVGEDNHLKAVDAIMFDYYCDPLYRNGFYDKVRVRIAYAELYPTEIPAKAPIFGQLFKRSHGAYTMAQLTMRRMLAQNLYYRYHLKATTLDGRKIDLLNNKEDIQQARYLVNISTASGFSARRGLESYVLWAKNVVLSDIYTLRDVLLFPIAFKGPLYAERVKGAFKEVLGRFFFYAVINSILRSIFRDEEKYPPILDPRDQRFGEIILPDGTRIPDPIFKLIHLTSILLTGQYRSRTTRKWHNIWLEPKEEVFDFAWSYLTRRFTPLFSVLVQIINRKTIKGEKITPSRIAESLLLPISLTNLLDFISNKDERNFWGAIGVIADTFGLSNTTPIRQIKFDKRVSEEVSRLQEQNLPKIQDRGLYNGFVNEFPYLSVEENNIFFKGTTDLMNDILVDLVSMPEYKALSDPEKAHLLSYMMDKAFETSKQVFLMILLSQRKKWTGEQLFVWLKNLKKSGFVSKETIKALLKEGALPIQLIEYVDRRIREEGF